jgi:AraC-like DNA-binding protein
MQFYISILGFFVTFLLLLNIKETNKVNYYLFIFLLINNLYNLVIFTSLYTTNAHVIAVLVVNFAPLYVLLGPLLYFYVRGILKDDYRLKKLDLLHFIPFVLYFINISNHLFSTYEHKVSFANAIIAEPSKMMDFNPVLIPAFISHVLRPILAISYILVCFYLIYKYNKKQYKTQGQNLLINRWLIVLLVCVLVIYISFLISISDTLNASNIVGAVAKGYVLVTLTMISLILLNISVFFFPNILYGLPQLDYKLKSYPKHNLQDIKEENKNSYWELEISNEKIELLKEKIKNYCLAHPYLQVDFSLSKMSEEINVPIHHISYYFNVVLNTNFSAWKNTLRIIYVVELMKQGSTEVITLDALSRQAGFVSRSTFVNAFKQNMGQTPSEFLSTL